MNNLEFEKTAALRQQNAIHLIRLLAVIRAKQKGAVNPMTIRKEIEDARRVASKMRR